MLEKSIPLLIIQEAIARKALHPITKMKNFRMTNKSLKELNLPPLTVTQFTKLLKGTPSAYDMDVRNKQNIRGKAHSHISIDEDGNVSFKDMGVQ